MHIRKYCEDDKLIVYKLFRETIQNINLNDYDIEQIREWVDKSNLEIFNDSLLASFSVVCEKNSEIIGFGDINQDGYLDRLYTHKDFQNIGVGTIICDALENNFKGNKVYVHASITARKFFEKRGYKVIKSQSVKINNVELMNFIMSKEK